MLNMDGQMSQQAVLKASKLAHAGLGEGGDEFDFARNETRALRGVHTLGSADTDNSGFKVGVPLSNMQYNMYKLPALFTMLCTKILKS